MTGVDLRGSLKFGDRDVVLLRMFKSLRCLSLIGFKLSDAGFLELGSPG